MNVSTVLTQINSAGQIPYSVFAVLTYRAHLKCNVNIFFIRFLLFQTVIAMTKAAMDNATMAMGVELAKHKVCLLIISLSKCILKGYRAQATPARENQFYPIIFLSENCKKAKKKS